MHKSSTVAKSLGSASSLIRGGNAQTFANSSSSGNPGGVSSRNSSLSKNFQDHPQASHGSSTSASFVKVRTVGLQSPSSSTNNTSINSSTSSNAFKIASKQPLDVQVRQQRSPSNLRNLKMSSSQNVFNASALSPFSKQQTGGRKNLPSTQISMVQHSPPESSSNTFTLPPSNIDDNTNTAYPPKVAHFDLSSDVSAAAAAVPKRVPSPHIDKLEVMKPVTRNNSAYSQQQQQPPPREAGRGGGFADEGDDDNDIPPQRPSFDRRQDMQVSHQRSKQQFPPTADEARRRITTQNEEDNYRQSRHPDDSHPNDAQHIRNASGRPDIYDRFDHASSLQQPPPHLAPRHNPHSASYPYPPYASPHQDSWGAREFPGRVVSYEHFKHESHGGNNYSHHHYPTQQQQQQQQQPHLPPYPQRYYDQYNNNDYRYADYPISNNNNYMEKGAYQPRRQQPPPSDRDAQWRNYDRPMPGGHLQQPPQYDYHQDTRYYDQRGWPDHAVSSYDYSRGYQQQPPLPPPPRYMDGDGRYDRDSQARESIGYGGNNNINRRYEGYPQKGGVWEGRDSREGGGRGGGYYPPQQHESSWSSHVPASGGAGYQRDNAAEKDYPRKQNNYDVNQQSKGRVDTYGTTQRSGQFPRYDQFEGDDTAAASAGRTPRNVSKTPPQRTQPEYLKEDPISYDQRPLTTAAKSAATAADSRPSNRNNNISFDERPINQTKNSNQFDEDGRVAVRSGGGGRRNQDENEGDRLNVIRKGSNSSSSNIFDEPLKKNGVPHQSEMQRRESQYDEMPIKAAAMNISKKGGLYEDRTKQPPPQSQQQLQQARSKPQGNSFDEQPVGQRKAPFDEQRIGGKKGRAAAEEGEEEWFQGESKKKVYSQQAFDELPVGGGKGTYSFDETPVGKGGSSRPAEFATKEKQTRPEIAQRGGGSIASNGTSSKHNTSASQRLGGNHLKKQQSDRDESDFEVNDEHNNNDRFNQRSAVNYQRDYKTLQGNSYDTNNEDDRPITTNGGKYDLSKIPGSGSQSVKGARGATKSAQSPFEQGDEYNSNMKTKMCSQGCGRKFALESLPKHEKVCKKVFQQKRKTFDSAAMRTNTEELTEFRVMGGSDSSAPIKSNKSQQQQKKPSHQEGKPQKKEEKEKPRWQKQSEALRAVLKANQSGKEMDPKTSGLVSEAFQSEDYVPCGYCGRKFNSTAAKRHIPFCASKAQQTQNKGTKSNTPTVSVTQSSLSRTNAIANAPPVKQQHVQLQSAAVAAAAAPQIALGRPSTSNLYKSQAPASGQAPVRTNNYGNKRLH